MGKRIQAVSECFFMTYSFLDAQNKESYETVKEENG